MGLVLELSHSDAVRKRWPDSSLYRSVNVNELQGCPLCLAALSWIFSTLTESELRLLGGVFCSLFSTRCYHPSNIFGVVYDKL